MNSLLLVIDVQKSFMNDYTKQIVKDIEKFININSFDNIAFTKFINNEDTPFYKVLDYKGCMNDKEKEIVIDTKEYKVFEKDTYTAFNKDLQDYIKNNTIDTIYLCGVDTEACVLKTALDLFENNYNVKVLKNYCMSSNGCEVNNNALIILEKLIGKQNVIDMLF